MSIDYDGAYAELRDLEKGHELCEYLRENLEPILAEWFNTKIISSEYKEIYRDVNIVKLIEYAHNDGETMWCDYSWDYAKLAISLLYFDSFDSVRCLESAIYWAEKCESNSPVINDYKKLLYKLQEDANKDPIEQLSQRIRKLGYDVLLVPKGTEVKLYNKTK